MRNLPHGFDIYLVNVKTIRQISQIFVASSEKLNFKQQVLRAYCPNIYTVTKPSACSLMSLNM